MTHPQVVMAAKRKRVIDPRGSLFRRGGGLLLNERAKKGCLSKRLGDRVCFEWMTGSP
jgi:hypothetical protein